MNKKRTLIISAVVMTLLSFMANCSCTAFAHAGEDEKELIDQVKMVERDNLGDLHKTLKLNISDSNRSSTFRMYCLSLAMKKFSGTKLKEIVESVPEDLNLHDVKNSSYATLLYRSVYSLNKETLPEVKNFLEKVTNDGKKFLLANKFNFSKFKNYSYKYQMNLLRSIDVMKQNLMFNSSESIDIQENLNLIEVSDLKENVKVWIAFAKISKDANKCESALRKVFKVWGNNFNEIAENDQGKDALIAFAKIPTPFLKDEQRSAIKAAIVSLGGISSNTAKSQRGMDALITFAKLSNNVNAQVNAIQTVLKSRGESFNFIAQDDRGIDLLITFAKVDMPSRYRNKQISALQYVFKAKGKDFDEIAIDKQGRDALITFAKLSKDTNEQVKAMRAVFKAKGGNFKLMAKDEQGVYAIVTFSQISAAYLYDKQMEAIKALLEEKGNDYNAVAKSDQGINALIIFIKKSHDTNEKINALSAICRSSYSSKYHKEIIMLADSISMF